MPTNAEMDAMALMVYGLEWRSGKLREHHGQEACIVVMQLAIAAKHAKAACDLAEDSANYMARLVL